MPGPGHKKKERTIKYNSFLPLPNELAVSLTIPRETNELAFSLTIHQSERVYMQ